MTGGVWVKAKRAQSVDDDESWKEGGVAPTLNAFDNAGESRATVLAVPIQDGRPITKRQNGSGIGEPGDPSYTIDTTGATAVATLAFDNAGESSAAVIAFGHTQGLDAQPSTVHTPTLRREGGGADGSAPTLGVRRLTPRECERLMGWPDDHTRYSADGTEIADSARYKMCGNGVAAPVARYVAECIGAML